MKECHRNPGRKRRAYRRDSVGWGSQWTIYKQTYLQENKLTGEENKEDCAIYTSPAPKSNEKELVWEDGVIPFPG